MTIKDSQPTDENQAICLIGPVAPYRGGVAQYTTQLAESLKARASLSVISFKRLYPSWLYPGGKDKEKAEKFNNNVKYLIDCYSPLSLRSVVKLVESKKPDLIIITWWTLFWQPGSAYIAYSLRKKGFKVAFLCHNLYDHGAKGFITRVSKKLLKSVNLYIVHSTEQEVELKQINPDAKVLKRVIPIYSSFPKPTKTFKKRGDLEVLFFGFIRPYKGLEVLLDSLDLLKNPQLHTTIIGEVWSNQQELEAKIASYEDLNIETHLGYMPEAEVANYFDRADVVVLPYLSATGSGVIPVAYNYGKPVLTTDVGGLKEAVIDGETGWLVAPGSPRELADVIAGITREKAASMAPAIKNFCKENSWDEMAQKIVEFSEQAQPKS